MFGAGLFMATDMRKASPGDLSDVENAASKITVQGARYPEKLEKMTGL